MMTRAIAGRWFRLALLCIAMLLPAMGFFTYFERGKLGYFLFYTLLLAILGALAGIMLGVIAYRDMRRAFPKPTMHDETRPPSS